MEADRFGWVVGDSFKQVADGFRWFCKVSDGCGWFWVVLGWFAVLNIYKHDLLCSQCKKEQDVEEHFFGKCEKLKDYT